MLLRPSFHNSRSLSHALSEPLRSNLNTHYCPNYGPWSHGRGSGGLSFSIGASLSPVSTEDRTAVSGSIASQNGALLDRFLLQEEDLKEGSVARSEPDNTKLSENDLRLGGLDNVLHSYSEKFVIRCYEVGMNRTASIETIANLLQEVACNHAQSVGFSTDGFATTPSMRKRRLIWVTTRMHIEVEEYPVWGDIVEIETWCQGEGKAGTRRDWLISDVANSKLIGRATSTWVMMNQDSRRLSRITDDVREEYANHCPVLPRYAFPEENSSSLRKIPKLGDPAQHVRSGLMPRRGDLDMNQHVNNVTYIGWILESTPLSVLDTHQLHRITLDYRRECKHGDSVESLASLESCYEEGSRGGESGGFKAGINGLAQKPNIAVADGVEFLHLLRIAGSNIEINRGRTVWKRKSERAQ
ncbi:hypothetical protein GOP47_0003292 [Adiantum capillus-veneris]|uniref:Acyl-[acyl-carrier-protein] hydrolase n=1 Tax=Adiantum capillus-veneris TaxID=13818 RepID=A0A9D4VAD1_ADICA|nr:hypothetical protein GOP47_0002437 [Adiantum capillus-veneris]KAI5083549.1 hypothetical protein GOP47_0003292 [Adiantum capillus-veneris]